MELIVAYFRDLDCNNSVENNGEWVINENVSFNYSPCLDDAFNFVHTNSLHLSLPISEMACMLVKNKKESVFVIPPKWDQFPIVFGRVQT